MKSKMQLFSIKKKDFGFQFRYLPQSKDFENFENYVVGIIRLIEFKENTNEFQKKLKR